MQSTGGAGRQGTHIVRSPNPLIKIISNSSKKKKKKESLYINNNNVFFSYLNIVVSMDSFKNLKQNVYEEMQTNN